MNRIHIDNISKSFSASYVLRNFSLEIAAGAAQAVVGPNGSGKSTLLKCIAGLERPDEGSISVGEWNIRSSSDYSACKRACGIGFLGKANGLYRDFTVRENLDLAVRLSERTAKPRSVDSILDEMDLNTFASKRVAECSQGIARRVGLARYLVIEPGLLILDEPLANLDPVACEITIAALVALREKGCTMVIATHNATLRNTFCTDEVELSIRQAGRGSHMSTEHTTMGVL